MIGAFRRVPLPIDGLPAAYSRFGTRTTAVSHYHPGSLESKIALA